MNMGMSQGDAVYSFDTQRDQSPNPRPTSHPNCSLPRTQPAPCVRPPPLWSHLLPLLNFSQCPFSLPHASSTYCSFSCCSELPPPGPSLAQDRVKYLCPGSHNRPCVLCFAPTTYLGESCLHGRLLHYTQNCSFRAGPLTLSPQHSVGP